jgi:hypothetical protein
MDVLCNGAGEMPGHEGEGSYDSHFEPWLEENEELIIEQYKDSITTILDVPQEYIAKMYEAYEWDAIERNGEDIDE